MSPNTKLQPAQQTQLLAQQNQALSHDAAKQETDLLFYRMASIYGQAWLQNFPLPELLEGAKNEWCKQIRNYTTFEIEIALQSMIESGDKYPPNLPVFVKRLNENKERRRYKTYGAVA